ncbi:hypothetical protein EJ110_NYTH53571 [Nymphaea thermarum]|nr:hypothetical protein EJ110_NYTH53571 [Nymphaea thermarum]
MHLRGAGQQKLLPRYVGPYKINRRVGKLFYELLLPEGSSIHPVFHVSKLKLCTNGPIGEDIDSAPILEEATDLSPFRHIGMRKVKILYTTTC